MHSTPPTVDQVREALRSVDDPELHASIVDLGMVREVQIDTGGRAEVTIALTVAACPLRAEIRRAVEDRVGSLPGVTGVDVKTGEMTPDEKAALMSVARRRAAESAPATEIASETRVLAVASGKGGVGKSSVTVNLAAALAARGLTVGVLDADIWGFSVPRMLGVSGRLGGADGKIHPNTLVVPRGDSAESGGASASAGAPGLVKVVSMGFLVDDEESALMWRGLILAKAVEQFLTDVRWGPMDYLLVDMPPGTGDIQMALARLLPAAQLLVVTTPGLGAQKVAARVADMARRSHLRIAGVIENMSAFVCDHGETYALFGAGGGASLAAELGAPLVAQVPLEPSVSAGGDAGRPVVLGSPEGAAGTVFRGLAGRIVDELAPPVEMAGCTARMLDAVEQSLDAQA